MARVLLLLVMCLTSLLGAQSGTLGRIRGVVISAVDSSPLVWAIVGIRGPGTTEYAAATDTAGAFKIDSVPPGTYVLLTRAFMYDEFQDTLRIAAADDRTVRITLRTRCRWDSASALREIARGGPLIVENGSIAPQAYSTDDRAFERRYQVRYVILGDGNPEPTECVASHNRVVFRFLDAKFGSQWRQVLRISIHPK